MNAAVVSVCVMLVLFVTRETASISQELQAAANAWQGSLPCGGWNCECAARQQSCCCAAAQIDELEEQMFTRLLNSFNALSELKTNIEQITACRGVAFTASMSQMFGCFGPFTSDLPIPYSNTTLNHGNGYNPALGIFTAPCAGVFSFSLTVYSNKLSEGQRLYQRVALVRQGRSEVATWEDNREDAEDSATQTVLFSLRVGEQVYAQLMSGREICGDIWGRNIFSGYILYPAES
ncbi:collagen alpha-2(VIII) chain-like [Garra rufa]|uniref:collagen alpha-2(VIII) chain-like n=1 Tax=Garra rufa TaxID=137080 RepID=UPI003CCE7883